MVDAVDLGLIEHAEKLLVKRTRGILIASKRLFDDDARPRFVGLGAGEISLSQLLDNFQIDFRRSGEIEKAIAAQLSLSSNRFEQSARRGTGSGTLETPA